MKKVIAFTGNPNVGKSSIFNLITGLHQHTGNWPGKTVTSAWGDFKHKDNRVYKVVDLPGCYSLFPHSQEEEVASDFICHEHPDVVVVVCDATSLQRNLILLLQVLQATSNVIVCVNLMDEAKKKQIHVDCELLSKQLHIPVIATSARSKEGIETLKDTIVEFIEKPNLQTFQVSFSKELQELIQKVNCFQIVEQKNHWKSIVLLHQDMVSWLTPQENIQVQQMKSILFQNGFSKEQVQEEFTKAFAKEAKQLYASCVTIDQLDYYKKDRLLDRIFTSKWSGYTIMIALLFLVFWITIEGANVPSSMLSNILFAFQDKLVDFATALHIAPFIYEPIIFGVYRVLAWVVSVMLPPMAIFFPLFTLLEDFGYLPRVAYNLDHIFQKCKACGKQALTMCMGFGCNAAGVVGCRIIDSKRERLIAIITNNFVPCNGRFPTIIAIISMFLIGGGVGFGTSFLAAVLLTVVIVLGIVTSFIVSYFLSKTLLKGEPSSFTLELPPYRKPQMKQVLVRSLLDRTIKVLLRAIVVAAPAGLIIWALANIQIAGTSILLHCTNFLDPFAHLMGLDGVILMAFILGMPANEIVVPIMLMTYLSQNTLLELDDLMQLKEVLVNNGWTILTAINTILFSLMHFPCATTLLTIKKETQSRKWTMLSFLIPTIIGVILCMITTFIYHVLIAF